MWFWFLFLTQPADAGKTKVNCVRSLMPHVLDVYQLYTSDQLNAEEQARAVKKLRQPKIGAFPHGIVSLTIRRNSIEAADTATQLVVFLDETGKEIARLDGPRDVANTPPAPGPIASSAVHWWNRWNIPVPGAAPWTAHVIDKRQKHKCVLAWDGSKLTVEKM